MKHELGKRTLPPRGSSNEKSGDTNLRKVGCGNP